MKKSTLSGITAILLAGVIAGGVCAAGYASRGDDGKWFKNGNITTWHWSDKLGDKKPDGDKPIYADAANIEVNQKDNNGIMLASSAMLLSDCAAFSISENADSVQMLTARLSPNDATYQAVDFTIKWSNENSTWATGKNISDYLTVSQSSDGALQCAVTCLQPFGEPAIITCTARPLVDGSWSPSATCVVNYYKRAVGLSSLKFNISGYDFDDEGSVVDEDADEVNFLAGTYTLKYINNDHGVSVSSTVTGVISVSFNYGIGTTTNIHEDKNVTLKVKSAYISELTNILGSAPTEKIVYNGNYSAELEKGLQWKNWINEICGGESNVTSKRNALYSYFNSKYSAGENVFEFVVNGFTVDLKFNPLALGIAATHVNLDKPSINF